MAPVFARGQKVLFIGDSITDCGRRDQHAPYGAGYVHAIWRWLGAAYPSLRLTIVNKGISGNTTRNLLERWEEDVVAEQPDWLAIKIGVNDVWRAIEGRYAEAVSLEEYERNYRRMIDRASAATPARLILIEPFLVETRAGDPFRAQLDAFRSVVARLAEQHRAIHVGTQSAFDAGLTAQPAAYWATDRVHPTEIGHMLIAQTVLRACGCIE